MSKLKQSIAVLRQIPEHIRDNYPLFVEFIKIYYQYLEETQQQDLESLHDIDKVTDEFIDRFKGELSRNFPIHLASDKRLVLKHLREFYLSRGSEASYKFLFRTLFNKEASLYYPSRQMLRVSDGRWTQDVSIFVREIGPPLPNATDPIGKAVYIRNSRGKTIRTYVKNIVNYSEDIYEVFIERDYINEISVGDIATDETGTYKAIILPCPTSIKVYKGGKGFSVGEIYALKTQLGRGCVIKITKVDSEGSIQRVQVIRFGLDYETKFYSYLSHKENAAYEYIHPLKIGTGAADSKTYEVTTAGTNAFNVQYAIEAGTSLLLVEVIRNGTLVTPTPSYSAINGTSVTVNNLQVGDTVQLYGILTKGTVPGVANPAYNELSGGFVDYGWASKQNYFYYDKDIPVGDESWAVDRYFADPSYVGEIVQQFYNDASLKVVDEDLAIIEIELGSVAKYPGYYSTADGFISDEIYIQDGNYYQAFSYVVRVEEELRRYVDIIKALVHPAGMKIFSEYSIFNQLNLQYTQPRSFLSLTLPLYDHPPSNIITDDRGIGYDSYDTVIQGNNVIVTPSEGANAVYANQGKASYHTLKKILDAVSTSDNVDNKHVFKLLEDAITERYIETQSSDLEWIIKRSYDETISKLVEKPFADNIESLPVTVQKAVTKALNDSVTQSETLAKFIEKTLADIITERYTQVVSSDPTWTIKRSYEETISKLFEKPFADVLAESVSVVVKQFYKNLEESIPQTDFSYAYIEKPLTDSQSLEDAPSKLVEKPFTIDSVNTNIESVVKLFFKNLAETIEQPDTVEKSVSKTIEESQDLIEYIAKDFSRILSDSITERYTETQSSDLSWIIKRSYDETIEKLFGKNVNDSILSSDNDKFLIFYKNLSETQLTEESLNFFIEKIHAEVQALSDLLANAVSKVADDNQLVIDFDELLVQKFLDDVISSVTDSDIFLITKNISDQQVIVEYLEKSVDKIFQDYQTVAELLSNALSRVFDDKIESTQDAINYFTSKGFNEEVLITEETYYLSIQRLIVELQNILDSNYSLNEKRLFDEQSLTDVFLITRAKLIDDIIESLQELVSNSLFKLTEDSINSVDSSANVYDFNRNEVINTSMSGKIWLNPLNLEEYSAYDEDYFSYTPLT